MPSAKPKPKSRSKKTAPKLFKVSAPVKLQPLALAVIAVAVGAFGTVMVADSNAGKTKPVYIQFTMGDSEHGFTDPGCEHTWVYYKQRIKHHITKRICHGKGSIL